MARPLRIEYPGAFYHIISRGNAWEDIFVGGTDKAKFTEYLEKASQRFSIVVHSYCLMRNHYHLLIETPHPNLSKAIQWLNVSYALYHNKKRERHGHLFQGRFRSILIGGDEYLMELSRYIHLNPVRAHILEDPALYKWSSYAAFIGKERAPKWLETGRLLAYFGSDKKKSTEKYREFVEDGKVEAAQRTDTGLAGGFIFGRQDFIDWVKETFINGRNEDREIPDLRKWKTTVSPTEITQHLCASFGCNEEDIVRKGKKKNKIRDLAIYLARDLSGLNVKKLGLYFGGISGSAVTMRYNRVAEEMREDEETRGSIMEIRTRLLSNNE